MSCKVMRDTAGNDAFILQGDVGSRPMGFAGYAVRDKVGNRLSMAVSCKIMCDTTGNDVGLQPMDFAGHASMTVSCKMMRDAVGNNVFILQGINRNTGRRVARAGIGGGNAFAIGWCATGNEVFILQGDVGLRRLV